MIVENDSICGKGYVQEMKPGYYCLNIYYRDINGEKKRKSFGGKDVNALYDRANEFLLDLDAIKKGTQKNATIPQLLRYRYEMDYRKGYVHEPGYARNINSLKKIEGSFIGSIPIAKITSADIGRFLDSMTGYSNSVLSKTFLQLKLAYREALAAGITDKNLMESREFRCPKSSRRDTKVRAFTLKDQKRFVEVLTNHPKRSYMNDYRMQLLIELYTGMRMGEINALKPADIDLENDLINVRATISSGINGRVFRREHPKTDAGIREVPINDLVRPILIEALEQAKDNKAGTIFYDYREDKVIATSAVCNYFKRICEKYDLPYYGQHALRHTFATRCIEAGIQPLVLKTWMGHTDIHGTLDTYADVFDRMNAGAKTKLESYLGGDE